jgi:hypothetical protein
MPAPLEVKGKGGSKGKSKKPKDDDFLDALEGLN